MEAIRRGGLSRGRNGPEDLARRARTSLSPRTQSECGGRSGLLARMDPILERNRRLRARGGPFVRRPVAFRPWGLLRDPADVRECRGEFRGVCARGGLRTHRILADGPSRAQSELLAPLERRNFRGSAVPGVGTRGARVGRAEAGLRLADRRTSPRGGEHALLRRAVSVSGLHSDAAAAPARNSSVVRRILSAAARLRHPFGQCPALQHRAPLPDGAPFALLFARHPNNPDIQTTQTLSNQPVVFAFARLHNVWYYSSVRGTDEKGWVPRVEFTT